MVRTVLRTLAALVLASALLAPTAIAHEDLATLDLSAYKGKVVYLDFWASWCTPCRRSFPWLDAMQRKHGDAGLVVITVNVDTERKLATDFLREVPVGFKVYYDPKGELAAKWQLLGMPSSFLIDRSGKVRSRHESFKTEQTAALEAQLVELLKEPVGATP
jgi:cytochrome c biogenesis protein CcmG, thiol:disulfide interchange protein DsbE